MNTLLLLLVMLAGRSVTDMQDLREPRWADTLKTAPWYVAPLAADFVSTTHALDRCSSCVETGPYPDLRTQAAWQGGLALGLSIVDSQGIARIKWKPGRLALRWTLRGAVFGYFGRAAYLNTTRRP